MMQKKLKKVDENKESLVKAKLNSDLKLKVEALNNSYKGKDGNTIDLAIKDLFDFLDTIITKEHPFYTQIKNYTWQKNHLKILASISTQMQEKNRMPTNNEISIDAGLSEETVYKHLREFKNHDLYKHEADKYQLMIHRVLSKVFNLSVQGDIRACKVFLDYFAGNTIGPAMPPPKHTNYIQINNLKITATDLEQLPPATLQKIENLIKLPVNKKQKIY
jgi:hypothetical protein